MSTAAIEVDGLGKRYLLGEREQYQALRDVLSSAPRRLVGRVRRADDDPSDRPHTWALRDVEFAVQPGEVLGIIGHNGAGKSTLLKILSRITRPTEGRAVMRGRIGSLLEVGSGFHPELTGAENILLNGAILGMSRAEVRERFDEIVAFAGVEQFLQTPVKRYSTGMYMRLAFAVAAHLEPEILIIDEVLAVGDAEFQRKCIGRMNELSRGHGRTVLFVSHNLAAVKQLCPRSIWLDNGRMRADGPTADVIDHYLEQHVATATAGSWIDMNDARRIGTGEVRFERIRYDGPDDPQGLPRPGGRMTSGTRREGPPQRQDRQPRRQSVDAGWSRACRRGPRDRWGSPVAARRRDTSPADRDRVARAQSRQLHDRALACSWWRWQGVVRVRLHRGCDPPRPRGRTGWRWAARSGDRPMQFDPDTAGRR